MQNRPVRLHRPVVPATYFRLLAHLNMPWPLYGRWASVIIGSMVLMLVAHRGLRDTRAALRLVVEVVRDFVNFGAKVNNIFLFYF